MTLSAPGRLSAAAIALTAWSGIGLLLAHQTARLGGSFGAALWANARFFTDVSNLLIALVFTALAMAPSRVPKRLLGMPLTATLMASAVYYGLLGGASALGANGPGDVIAHAVVPLLVTLFWLAVRPTPPFRFGDVGWWSLFPLGYCGYAIARGLVDGRYPYFFLDVSKGVGPVLLYVAAILLLFAAIGALVVLVDRRLAMAVRRPRD